MIEDQLSRKWNKFFNHRHPRQLRCQGETITILNYYSITWYLEYKKAQNVEFWAQFKWLASWLQKLQLPLMVFPTVIDEHDSDDKAIAIVDMWMCGLRITSILQFANYPKMCAALNDFVQRIACPAEMQILGQIASGSKLWPEWASLMQCNEPRNCLQPSIAVLLEKCIAILRYRPLQLEKSGQEPVSGFNLPSGRCPLPSPHLCTIVHVSIATAVANVVFSIGILRSCLLLY